MILGRIELKMDKSGNSNGKVKFNGPSVSGATPVMFIDSVCFSFKRFFKQSMMAQQLVLYNEAERKLQVVEEAGAPAPVYKSNNAVETLNLLGCSLCGRPWTDGDGCSKSPSKVMDRNYFRLLDISSRSSIPRRRSSPQLLSSSSTVSSNSSKTFENFIFAKNLSESSFNQGYYARFFKELNRLGRGAGGSVFQCQHILDSIELGAYAVKKVPIGDNHEWLNRMLKEVHILENLRHPNIIEYKHAWLEYHRPTPFGPTVPCLFILMQLANSGNLEDFLTSGTGTDTDLTLICNLFLQISRGLAHLHHCGILHRDLKPSNILIHSRNNEAITALITDFGEANDSPGSISTRTGATGTIEFVAPELILTEKRSGKYMYQQSKRTDMWSLGLIMYWMLTRRLPYMDINDIDALKREMKLLKQISLPKQANSLPRPYRDVMASLLQLDPELRPDIDQVLIMLNVIKAPIVPLNLTKTLAITNTESDPSSKEATPIPAYIADKFSQPIDDNSRISVALYIIFISVLPSYPSLPTTSRSLLAIAWTIFVLKSKRWRTITILSIVYTFVILSFMSP